MEKVKAAVSEILPCKLYESHDLEKQNQIY
jgi:hypothetical protein